MGIRRGFGLCMGLLLATGAAGAAGILATLLLHGVEGVFALLTGASASWVGPLAMGFAGFLAGCLWWSIRGRPLPSLTAVVEDPAKDFPVGRNTLDAAVQIFIVGAGASVGREVAPRQFAAALTHRLTGLLSLTLEDRRVLMAGSAGAALGAVYNTPFAGALYTLAVMLGSARPLAVVVALGSSWGGVAIASVVHSGHSYYSFPQQTITVQVWILLPVIVVLCSLVGAIFRRLCAGAKQHRVDTKYLPITIAAAMAATGTVALWQPDIVGNGVLVLSNGFNGSLSLQSLALLFFLKPLFTLLTLRAGAVGGVLTPALALGCAGGGVLAHLTNTADTAPLVMVLTAAAVLSVSERSAWFGSIFTAELIGANIVFTLLIGLVCLGSRAVQVAAGRLNLRLGRKNRGGQ